MTLRGVRPSPNTDRLSKRAPWPPEPDDLDERFPPEPDPALRLSAHLVRCLAAVAAIIDPAPPLP